MNIDKILKELTLEEKASLCSGSDFWHTEEIKRLDIPSIMVSDGPHGLRKMQRRQQTETFITQPTPKEQGHHGFTNLTYFLCMSFRGDILVV